jgi:hypothetical protein
MCLNLDLWFLLFYCLFVKFFPAPFRFFDLAFYYLFSFFIWFLSSFVFTPLLFRSCFVPVFLAHVVSSLAYPNLLGNKMFGCCCCPVLSQRRGVGTSQETPISAKSHRNHIISVVVVARARSSASVLDRDIAACFLDFHAIEEDPRRIQ